jgi:hypothetical protein
MRTFKISIFFSLAFFSLFALSACSLSPQKAALDISSYPTATIFLNDEEIGTTPYKNTSLKPGNYKLKLVPTDSAIPIWEKNIPLNNKITTIVDYQLSADKDQSNGYVLYFEKAGAKDQSGLVVTTKPDVATVAVDGQMQGFAPINIPNISEGDHQILVSFPGYQSKEIYARGINSYRLVAEIQLAKDNLPQEPEPQEEEADETTDSSTPPDLPYVTILDTPTGWLRVRLEPSTSASEAGRVDPGKNFPLLDEKSGWYQIEYEDEQLGWISGQYAEKFE